MANFKLAEAITNRNEGFYANNKADAGGETYAGIARKFWPRWPGWLIIDNIKIAYGISAKAINAQAKKREDLTEMISFFYKANFWDVNKLDQFHDQQIANTVYDFSVNAGVVKAAKTLQEVLGVPADGKIGPITIDQVNKGNFKAIHTAYNCKRKLYYDRLAEKPSQKQFLASWISRIKDYA